MRAVLILLISMMGIGSAAAEEWVSRTGYCFEWEGSWAVNRERSGLVGRQYRIHPRRRALRQSDTSGGRAARAGWLSSKTISSVSAEAVRWMAVFAARRFGA